MEKVKVVQPYRRYYTEREPANEITDRRYPVFYVDYHLVVKDFDLFPEDGKSIWSNTTNGGTNPDFSEAHQMLGPDEEYPLAPWEVQFETQLFSEFKKIVMHYIDPKNDQFHLEPLVRSADEHGLLQWRGTLSYPGGPTPRIINVAKNFAQFGRMAARAVPPKRCVLTLWMDDPDAPNFKEMQAEKYWTRKPKNNPIDTYPKFVPNGEPLPPREDCVLVYTDPSARPKYRTQQYASVVLTKDPVIPTITPRKRANTL